MNVEKLMEIIHTTERLKDTTRHCYTSGGRRESVAEHSWRIALMAMLVQDEFPETDIDKVIRMCLIHDLGEIFTGDIPSFLKTEADSEREDRLLAQWVESLPEPYREEFRLLYQEMQELKTPEAKLYKAMDGLEAVIQHNESDISTWSDNEYELNLTYANDKVAHSPYLRRLRELACRESLQKIEEEKHRKAAAAENDACREPEV